jgi:hypothetical protein
LSCIISAAAKGAWYAGSNGKKYFKSYVQNLSSVVRYKNLKISKFSYEIFIFPKVADDFSRILLQLGLADGRVYDLQGHPRIKIRSII